MLDKPRKIVSEGLGHPEGPYELPDGRVVLANSYKSEIAVYDPKTGKTGQYAFTGGAPNACMLGTDGNVYSTNCPNVGAWWAPEKRPASIMRSTPSGKTEVVATEASGVKLNAPNDLTFGPDGRLYFTDSGDWDPATKPHPGYICAINGDGSCELLEDLGKVYPNGIVAEPDGSLVWVESYTLNVVRRTKDGRKTVIHTLPDGHIPDGLKIDVDGNLWITTVASGGLDVLRKDGSHKDFMKVGTTILNCVFGRGGVMYCCDMGVFDTSGAGMGGCLWRVEVGVEGMPLFKGAIS